VDFVPFDAAPAKGIDPCEKTEGVLVGVVIRVTPGQEGVVIHTKLVSFQEAIRPVFTETYLYLTVQV